jgi:hypothetical protein
VNGHPEESMKRFVFALSLLALTAPAFAQGGRGGAPAAPIALEPGAAHEYVD